MHWHGLCHVVMEEASMKPQPSVVVALMASVLPPGTAAWGQGVGGAGPAQTQFSLLPLTQLPEDPLLLGVTIGTAQSPIPIELDPAGPMWSMQLAAPGISSPRGSRVTLGRASSLRGHHPGLDGM